MRAGTAVVKPRSFAAVIPVDDDAGPHRPGPRRPQPCAGRTASPDLSHDGSGRTRATGDGRWRVTDRRQVELLVRTLPYIAR